MTEPDASSPEPTPVVKPLMQVHNDAHLDDPLMVVALDGWIDAGTAAATAMATIRDQIGATLLATFDSDVFIDYRARRPTMHIRDGVNTGLTWPEIVMHYGKEPNGRDVIVLSGPEPDAQWFAFTAAVRSLAVKLGVAQLIGLGAYPIAVPHTRPSMVSCTAGSADQAIASGLTRSSVDVPAGVAAALERSFSDMGIPSLGIWAQVPHYAAAMAYPGAAFALVETLNSLVGTGFVAEPLRIQAGEQRVRLDQLVAQSQEHLTMLHQLEVAYDEAVAEQSPLTAPGEPLPSGDELAAELEKFLRDQDS
ncbi:MAG: PAC2 family protein [Acidimicrobiia bacterium]